MLLTLEMSRATRMRDIILFCFTHLSKEQYHRQQEGVVDLGDRLYLIPLIGHKVRPPDTDGCRDLGGRGLSGTHGLAGRQQDSSRPLPVNEEDVNGTLVPDQVDNVEELSVCVCVCVCVCGGGDG